MIHAQTRTPVASEFRTFHNMISPGKDSFCSIYHVKVIFLLIASNQFSGTADELVILLFKLAFFLGQSFIKKTIVKYKIILVLICIYISIHHESNDIIKN